MAEDNLHLWPEISQVFEDMQLNSIAAALDYILAWHARLETRLIEHERRAAAKLPPLRPEPDPPDGPPLYAVAQQPYQPSASYQQDTYPPHQNPSTGYTNNAMTDPYMLSATTLQQLYAAQHTQQYLQLPSSYQPLPDTECLPYGLPQPNRQDPISVWFPQQQPKVSTPTCRDATDCHVSSVLPPAQQLMDWQQPHQLGMPLLEDPTPPQQPGPALAFGLPISTVPRPYQPVAAPLLASMPHPQVVPSSMLTEWETNMHEREEKTEIQVLVDEHTPPLETTKKDLEVGMEEKRRLFKDEHRSEHEELVFKKDVYLCAFVGDVASHALPKGSKETSFDGNIYSNVYDDTNKQSKKAKEFFSTMDVLKILHQLGARLKQMHSFDPGGDTSPKLLFATFFVLPWFPP